MVFLVNNDRNKRAISLYEHTYNSNFFHDLNTYLDNSHYSYYKYNTPFKLQVIKVNKYTIYTHKKFISTHNLNISTQDSFLFIPNQSPIKIDTLSKSRYINMSKDVTYFLFTTSKENIVYKDKDDVIYLYHTTKTNLRCINNLHIYNTYHTTSSADKSGYNVDIYRRDLQVRALFLDKQVQTYYNYLLKLQELIYQAMYKSPIYPLDILKQTNKNIFIQETLNKLISKLIRLTGNIRYILLISTKYYPKHEVKNRFIKSTKSLIKALYKDIHQVHVKELKELKQFMLRII